MARSSDTRAPIGGSSENSLPSSKINPKSSETTSPPENHRTIVLCFDGTGNQFSEENTNIVKLFSILKKEEPNEQVCYYQPGIGTYMKPGAVSPIFRWFAEVLDLMFAWYLSEHIIEGYMFLMEHYRPGDKICIFGFSRGAYTARALAGMLHKVGLLTKGNFENIPFAYNLYKHDDPAHDALAEHFKEAFCRKVEIEFLGVWDTVASMGYLWSRTLPFISSNTMIKVFRQALSLDEHRVRFRPNLFHRTPPPSSRRRGIPSLSQQTSFLVKGLKTVWKGLKRVLLFPIHVLTVFWVNEMEEQLDQQSDAQSTPPDSPSWEMDFRELWFKGCHSDIGGGNTKDTTEYSNAPTNFALSHIPLRWMIQEIVDSKCGIRFVDDDRLVGLLQRWHIPVKETKTPLPPKVPQPYDNRDAKARIIDELKPTFEGFFRWIGWCFMELLPTYYEWQEKRVKDGEEQWVWCWQFSWNLGRGRVLPNGAEQHESVKYCMSEGYEPRAQPRASFWGRLVSCWKRLFTWKSQRRLTENDVEPSEGHAGDDERRTGQQEASQG